MQTRSQSKKQKTCHNDEANIYFNIEDEIPEVKNNDYDYEFIYDFDYASECWKKNKKYVGNGCYKYICQGVTKKGKKCIKNALNCEIYCKIHLK